MPVKTPHLKKRNFRFYFVLFERTTFFTTEEIFNGSRTLQSKVFSAGVAGMGSVRGSFNHVLVVMGSALAILVLKKSKSGNGHGGYWVAMYNASFAIFKVGIGRNYEKQLIYSSIIQFLYKNLQLPAGFRGSDKK